MKNLLIILAFLTASSSASALDISGVKLDERISVDGTELVLNGAGTRKKFGLLDVYVAALYLTSRAKTAEAVINQAKPRRLLLVMRRTVDSKSMLDALHDAINDNTNDAQRAAIGPGMAKLDAIFLRIQPRENDRIVLDFGMDGGVRVAHNDQVKDTLPGPDIGPTLLKVWIGEKPVQANLKAALLSH
ncbi:MAG: chalcone isomerase family protein [Gammaproteobacteria bacterium]|nr:chalcone isomerase family protein [Gammaproteobacteria bacterium]